MTDPIFRPLFDLNPDGFHVDGKKAYQLLPVGGERTLKLMRAPGVVFKTVPTKDPVPESVANRTCIWGESGQTIQEPRIIRLRGASHGNAYYTAMIPGKYSECLVALVRRRKYVRVAFHFVSDNEGHHTLRQQGVVAKAVNRLNEILTPQANVEFKVAGVRGVQVPEDLGCLIGGESEAVCAEEWGKITKFGDPSADWNVFFVWDMRHPTAGDYVLAANHRRNCLVDDMTSNDRLGTVLAHEYCHSQGCGHVEGKQPQFLMNETEKGGTWLRLSDLEKVNPL
ncbi:MAG: hypothetical protein NTW74_22250 [Acidobacteria bacterium]|nr:hypothetical protein [Acidobacteriota bacterium]